MHQRLTISLAFALINAFSCLGDSVYVLGADLATGGGPFGAMDLGTGAFHQIGPAIEGSSGLAPGPNGSLLTLTFAGNLNSINPANGVTTTIGQTGLGDCTTPASPCGPSQRTRSERWDRWSTRRISRTIFIVLTL